MASTPPPSPAPAAPAPAAPAAPAASPQTPLGSSRFQVEFGLALPTPVATVSGIEVDCTAVETREGSDPTSGLKQPGQLNYTNLVLTRPMTKDLTLWNWMQEVIAGTPSQQAMTVTLMDSQGQPALTWEFKNAFPVRWTGPALNALASGDASETLEIAHTGFTMIAH